MPMYLELYNPFINKKTQYNKKINLLLINYF